MLLWTFMFIHLFVLYSFNSFEDIARSEIAGSYNNSMFNLLRNWKTVFHSNCIILHSHPFVFNQLLPFVFNLLQLRFHQRQITALVNITNNFHTDKSNDLFSQMTYSLHFKTFMAPRFQTDTLVAFCIHHWLLIFSFPHYFFLVFPNI